MTAVVAVLRAHPDYGTRAVWSPAGVECTAKRVVVEPTWKLQGTSQERTVTRKCHAAATFKLDGNPRCARHALRGLQGEDPA